MNTSVESVMATTVDSTVTTAVEDIMDNGTVTTVGNVFLATVENGTTSSGSLGNLSFWTTSIFNFSTAEAYDILVSHAWPRRRLFSFETELALVVLYALLTATGILCNGVVCYVMGRPSQRQLPRNLYVVNLALSDLTLSLVCTPFTLLLILQRTWTMGSALCSLLPVIQGANILVSAATITIIAIDRYVSIVTPNRGHLGDYWASRHVIYVCLAVWMAGLLGTLPVAFFQEVEEVTLHHVVLWRACVEKWPNPRLRGYYTVVVMFIQYMIPATVLTATHVQISRHLYSRGTAITQTQKQNVKELVRNQRATFTLIIISTVFATSWLPLHIFSLLVDFEIAKINVDHMYVVFAVCHSLAMTTACSNPILYGMLNTNFRREVLKLIRWKCLA